MGSKTFTEGRHTGEHIVSEASGARSREQGTLAAGSLVAGTVLALNGAGNYVQLAPDATDGAETAKGVLYANVDASEAPKPCVVHVRACEVHGVALTWPDAATEGQITAATNDLVSQGVIVR
ncbi:head decoration protein [Halomonas citrativorans]|uniref:Head decoration protein n=1 Tax=Halomonas citrativorans TaxID=2742612 RepID=A0ABR9FBH1_9GAMM|nr:head decoration protein [Halomonas citrativorans]MBE0403072.1 head decoration protein [Halomonas citrativorans]